MCSPNIIVLSNMQVFKKHVSGSSCYIRDFRDGLLYKQHALFGVVDSALQVIIYYDDVEVTNPLGSYRGQHKLGKQYTCRYDVFADFWVTGQTMFLWCNDSQMCVCGCAYA